MTDPQGAARRRMGSWVGLLSVGALMVAGPAVASTPTLTPSLVVTTATDGGTGSLREAIALANTSAGPDVVELDPRLGVYRLDLCPDEPEGGANSMGDLNVTEDLTINGRGAVIEQVCDDERVFDTVAPLTVNDTTITGGSAIGPSDWPELSRSGGGIRARGEQAEIHLIGVSVTDNEATVGGGLSGGEILIEDSVIRNNRALGGEPIVIGGAIAAGDITLRGSTVADNSSEGLVGAVAAFETLSVDSTTLTGNRGQLGAVLILGGSATITNSTLTDNIDPVTGSAAIAAFWQNANFYLRLDQVTIVERRPGPAISITPQDLYPWPPHPVVTLRAVAAEINGPLCQVGPGPVALVSEGGNVATGDLCAPPDPSDVADAPGPLLQPLADNGGTTETHLPMADTPIIDAIGCSPTLTADQRGMPRPQGLLCDAGAVELQVDTPIAPTTTSTTEPAAPKIATTPDSADSPPVAPPASAIAASPRFTG